VFIIFKETLGSEKMFIGQGRALAGWSSNRKRISGNSSSRRALRRHPPAGSRGKRSAGVNSKKYC